MEFALGHPSESLVPGTHAPGAARRALAAARWREVAGVYFARLDAPGGVSRVTRVARFE